MYRSNRNVTTTPGGHTPGIWPSPFPEWPKCDVRNYPWGGAFDHSLGGVGNLTLLPRFHATRMSASYPSERAWKAVFVCLYFPSCYSQNWFSFSDTNLRALKNASTACNAIPWKTLIISEERRSPRGWGIWPPNPTLEWGIWTTFWQGGGEFDNLKFQKFKCSGYSRGGCK